MPKKYLLAGLLAFIVDEGNVAEVIEIYSKNYELLKDIQNISIKCDYNCKLIREKYRYGIFDSYSNEYLVEFVSKRLYEKASLA